MHFEIEVNGLSLKVKQGETVLSALRENGVVIPTLCHMKRFSPTGACRLCVVEVAGNKDLVSSCSLLVEKGMKVFTNTPRVVSARKLVVEVLLANHPDDCLYCERNKNCELQNLADELNIKERIFFGDKRKHFPDRRSSSVLRDPAKCVLCSRCVRVCEEVQYVNALDFIGKGKNTMVGPAFHKALNASTCINCGHCIITCPTGALGDISHIERVQSAIENQQKEVIFVISPAVVASIAEHFGLKESAMSRGIICSALKRLGADKVFDLAQAISWNIFRETESLQQNLSAAKSGPLFSSCCPAWVKFANEHMPHLASNISQVKSPQQAMGRYLKTTYCQNEEILPENLVVVAIMPCVASKYEATLKSNTLDGVSEVDAVLTAREVIRFMRTSGIDVDSLTPSEFYEPFNNSNSLSWKTGYSGGKAEAVAKVLFQKENVPEGEFKFYVPKNQNFCKETKINLKNKPISFAWISGIKNAKDFIDNMIEEQRTDLDYIEVMACPGGCAGGGGQQVSRGNEKVLARKKSCQAFEKIYAKEDWVDGLIG